MRLVGSIKARCCMAVSRQGVLHGCTGVGMGKQGQVICMQWSEPGTLACCTYTSTNAVCACSCVCGLCAGQSTSSNERGRLLQLPLQAK